MCHKAQIETFLVAMNMLKSATVLRIINQTHKTKPHVGVGLHSIAVNRKCASSYPPAKVIYCI